MINKLPPFEGLNIRIPIIIPVKGRGFINQGSGLPCLRLWILTFSGFGTWGVGICGSAIYGLGMQPLIVCGLQARGCRLGLGGNTLKTELPASRLHSSIFMNITPIYPIIVVSIFFSIIPM